MIEVILLKALTGRGGRNVSKRRPIITTISSAVVACLLFMSYASSQEILRGPENVTAILDQMAQFSCITRGGAMSWLRNNTLIEELPSEEEAKLEYDGENIGNGRRFNYLRLQARDNDNFTMFQCVVRGIQTIFSNIAVLYVQGPLSAVGDLTASYSSSSVTVNWTAPFSLDVTGVDHDIWYSVIIYNVTDENNSTVINCTDCINITDTYYIFTPNYLSPCHVYDFSIIPMNGAGQGEEMNIVVTGEGCKLPTEPTTPARFPSHTVPTGPGFDASPGPESDVVIGAVVGTVVGGLILVFAVVIFVAWYRGRGQPQEQPGEVVGSVAAAAIGRAEQRGLLDESVSTPTNSSAGVAGEGNNIDTTSQPPMVGIRHTNVHMKDGPGTVVVYQANVPCNVPLDSDTTFVPSERSSQSLVLKPIGNTVVCAHQPKIVESAMSGLHDKSDQWKEFAQKMEIDEHLIDEIDTNNEEDTDCLRVCVEKWADKTDYPSLEKLLNILSGCKEDTVGDEAGVSQRPSAVLESGGGGTQMVHHSGNTHGYVDKSDSGERGLNFTSFCEGHEGVVPYQTKIGCVTEATPVPEVQEQEKVLVDYDLNLTCDCEEATENNCPTSSTMCMQEHNTTHDATCFLFGSNEYTTGTVTSVTKHTSPVFSEPPLPTNNGDLEESVSQATLDVQANKCNKYPSMQCTKGTITEGELPETCSAKKIKPMQRLKRKRNHKKRKRGSSRPKLAKTLNRLSSL